MKCWDCEYFKIIQEPLRVGKDIEELTNYIFAYPDDDYMTMECLCRKLVKHGLIDKVDGYYEPKAEEWNEPNYYDPALWE